MNTEEMCNEDRADKVALLFEECIDIADLVKRAAYLSEACMENPELQKEVEKLLRAHEASGSFLMGGTPRSTKDSDGNPVQGVADLEPGSSVGPYRLLGQIGEGSTSTIYLAEQEEPVRRWVALKVVKPGMDTRKVILRFSLERQALALMDHPGIAKLLDAGATSSGRPFFVMELVSGIGITSFCDENQLTIRQRLDLFVQICNAVLHAHQRGIIHRDIKPDNILASNKEGRTVLKIIDFGIAKVLHTWGQEETVRTGVMPFLGTPAYMSPEQVQMTVSDLDTRTDIYSLGALLYELLAGHPPFDHDQLMGAGLEEMCRIIRTVEPTAPSERLARIPEEEQAMIAANRLATPAELRRALAGDLDWITLKALEKSRDRRYPTTAGFANDITRHFEHLPVSAAAPSRRYRLTKLLRRNRKSVIATGVITSLMLVSSFIIVIMAINARGNAIKAQEMGAVATQAERQSHRAMVSMHVSSGLAAAADQHPDRAVLWFANAASAAGQEDYQAEVNTRRAISWTSNVSMPMGAFKLSSSFKILEFSRDSQYMVALGKDHRWQLWDARSQDLVAWPSEVGPIQAAAWSPQGSRLALVLTSGEVRVYEAADGTMLHAFSLSPVPVTIGFTPDSRFLVVGNTHLYVYDLEKHAPVEEFSGLSEEFVGLAFSERADQVVGVSSDGNAHLVRIPGGSIPRQETARVFPHKGAIRVDACTSKSNYREDFLEAAILSLPALAVNGTRMLTRTGSFEITLWDAASGDLVRKVGDVCCSCKFTTDTESGYLACGLQGGKVQIWDIAAAKPLQLLPSQGACVLDIAFGMGGKSLITAEANGLARVWAVEEGKELQSPLHHCTDVDRVAFAPNGRMVATGQSDGLVRIWNVLEMQSDERTLPRSDVPTVVRMSGSGNEFVLTREPSWEPCKEACVSQVALYSSESGTPLGETILEDGCVEAAAFSPDSNLLAVGIGPPGTGSPGRVKIRDRVGSRINAGEFDLPSGPASLAWNPLGGEIAVLCRSGEILVLEPGREKVSRWSTPSVSVRSRINPMLAYTPDGLTLISLGPDGVIEIREASSGNLRHPPMESMPDGFWSFSLSRDSRYMATATIDGAVAVWDLESGRMAGGVLQHPSWVYRCHFSPDQNYLVTASHDGKARLWDWRTGAIVAAPMVHPSEVYDAVFTPDNCWLLTACRDGNVRIWEPLTGQLLAPPIKVGQQAFNIEITGDGKQAVIGTLGRDVAILSLAVLQEESPFTAEELCLFGEVVSSCLIQKGSIRDLTTAEWMVRYDRLRTLHKDAFRFGHAYGLKKQTVEKTAVVPEVVRVTKGEEELSRRPGT